MISRSILLRMENVSDKFVETIKAHILCPKTLSRKSCLLWDNAENICWAGQVAGDNILRRMHFACRINKAIDTHTHSEYVSLIPLQMVTRRHINLTFYANYLSYFLIRLSCHTAADNQLPRFFLPHFPPPFLPNIALHVYGICLLAYLLTYLLTYILTYLLTYSMELTGLQVVKKFRTFYGTWMFITAFTSVRHLPYPEPVRSSPYPHIQLKIHLNIILPFSPC